MTYRFKKNMDYRRFFGTCLIIYHVHIVIVAYSCSIMLVRKM